MKCDVSNLRQLQLLSHPQTHTIHPGGSRLTQPYKYIFTAPVI